jgi:hypothetical protein
MKAFCTALFFTLLLTGKVSGGEPPVRLNVRDAYVLNLAVGLSNVMDQNIVVSGYSASRISINESFGSADEVYASLAKRLGGRMFKESGIRFLGPACLVVGATTDPPLFQNPISVHFHRIRAAALLEILAGYNNLPYREQEASGRAQILGLRLENVSSRIAHHAVAVASGTALGRRGDVYVAVGGEDDPHCGEVTELDILPRTASEGDCPSKLIILSKQGGKFPRCEPLERYPLKELVARGFIEVSGKRYLLIEADDRSTFFAREGDYLGHHFGKIVSADDGGFVVRESKQNELGHYYYEYTHIDYANKHRVLPRR